MSETNPTPSFVLYHTLTDADCAEVRTWIVKYDWIEQVQFRNIDRSSEAHADLVKLQGNDQVPFLVAEGLKLRGKSEILAFFEKKPVNR